MSQEIQSILEPNENILWQDVISRKVLFFNLIISFVIIIAISFFLFSKETIEYTSNGVPASISGLTLALAVLGLGSLVVLLNFFSKYVKKYLITDKRVLMKSGLIGTDFNSLYFTEVKNANVNVGIIGKIFSVGTINIDTGKVETVSSGSGANRRSGTRTAYDKLLHIDKPYEVYKYFQTSLTGRKESLFSGRADRENNPEAYED